MVFAAMQKVAADMAAAGVAKSQTNTHHKYKFRGIDDVMNAMSGSLAANNLLVTPKYTVVKAEIGTTKKGEAQHHVILNACYDLVCTVDASKHTICTIGEAMDTGDKATNKAMAAAYKYALTQAFCIPFEGMEDGDRESPEAPMPKQQGKPAQNAPAQAAPQPPVKGSPEEKKILRNQMDQVCKKHFLDPEGYKVGEQVQPWKDFMDSEVGAWLNKLPRKDLQDSARRYFKFKFYSCRIVVLGPDPAALGDLQDEMQNDNELNEDQKKALHKSMETSKKIPW